jgi:hypothetical protein
MQALADETRNRQYSDLEVSTWFNYWHALGRKDKPLVLDIPGAKLYSAVVRKVDNNLIGYTFTRRDSKWHTGFEAKV